MDDDRKLLDALLTGDETAARVFVDRFKFVAWGVFRRFRHFTREDCEDLFSNLCEKFWDDDCARLRRLRREWRGGSLEGYIRTAALNLARDLLRTRGIEVVPADPDEPPPDPVDPEPSPVYLHELQRMIKAALQHLTERCREALRLVDMEGYSYAEAANELGMNANAFGVQLKRCRKKFADICDREFPPLRTYLSEAL